MRKNLILTFIWVLITCVSLIAQPDPETVSSGGGIDWFELIILTGYLLGVFVLLPMVIFTNLKERLFNASENTEGVQLVENLSEEERNKRAAQILEKIEDEMTPFQTEEGEEMVTITKAKQAKLTKAGLDYINKKLAPTDQTIIDRVEEFSEVYRDRARRAFTGSKWIIACSVGIGILMFMTAGISTFIFIHALGLLFYILSSRTTFYSLEKRMKYFGAGLFGSILSGLFIGGGAKYYIKESGSSSWKRDWETEGQMAMIGLLIMFVVAMFLGFLAAFLGVINFVINYSMNFIIPFKPEEDFYEKHLAGSVQ